MDELRAQYDRYILPVYAPPAPVMVRGEGSRLFDADGRDYVDFAAGVAVVSLGHCAPAIRDALIEQARRLWHTSNLFANDAAIALAAALSAKTLGGRAFLCNSGAEAVEAALKLARRRGTAKHPEKYRVLAFENSFHGRIGFSLAACGQDKLKKDFGPLAPGFVFAPFNDIAQARAAAAEAGDNLAAVIAEPVQGEGGVNIAQADFLRALREIADAAGALLIFDEVQSGAGRCGALYAYQEFGVPPDLLATAKGIGGGFPVAAMIAAESAAGALAAGDHGSTFGGNPLACRVALAALNEIDKPDFLAGVRRRGEKFLAKLAEINGRLNCFREIRGKGLLVAADLHLPAAEVRAAALKAGTLTLSAGKNALRLAPPLNIPDDDIEEGFRRLEEGLRQAAR